MTAPDDIQRIAATLERPRPGYARVLERARIPSTPQPGEARRRIDLFADRVRDLTLPELIELYDETFRRGRLAGVEPMASYLARRPVDPAGAREALNVLTPALERLEADRNPFSYIVKDLCCVLLTRASAPHFSAL